MIISKLISAKFSLTSHLSYNSQNMESRLITVYVLWFWFLFAIVLCVCARTRVCEDEHVWVFFCMHVLYAVCWMGVDGFFFLLFYVIYSRTIASIANVFCWLYPTLNKVYLILSFFFLPMHLSSVFCLLSLWPDDARWHALSLSSWVLLKACCLMGIKPFRGKIHTTCNEWLAISKLIRIWSSL